MNEKLNIKKVANGYVAKQESGMTTDENEYVFNKSDDLLHHYSEFLNIKWRKADDDSVPGIDNVVNEIVEKLLSFDVFNIKVGRVKRIGNAERYMATFASEKKGTSSFGEGNSETEAKNNLLRYILGYESN